MAHEMAYATREIISWAIFEFMAEKWWLNRVLRHSRRSILTTTEGMSHDHYPPTAFRHRSATIKNC